MLPSPQELSTITEFEVFKTDIDMNLMNLKLHGTPLREFSSTILNVNEERDYKDKISKHLQSVRSTAIEKYKPLLLPLQSLTTDKEVHVKNTRLKMLQPSANNIRFFKD